MTGKELFYVKTVAEEMSISKASQKLFMTQPSLSNAVKKIEESLGVKLFIRTNKGLIMTYAGERYCQIASDILKIYSDFEIEVSDINNLKKGRLNISVTVYIATFLLPRILPEFNRIAPNIEFNFSEMPSMEQENELRKGLLDFAIMHIPEDQDIETSSDIKYTKVIKSDFLLVTKKDHPLKKNFASPKSSGLPTADLRMLQDETFILGIKTQRSRQVVDSILQKTGFIPKKTISTRNFMTAREFVAQGMGVTILPEFYLDLLAKDDRVEYFNLDESYTPSWDICIGTHANSYLSKAAELFISLIGKEFDKPDLVESVKNQFI